MSSMEIEGFPTEALTETGLKLFEPSKRNGLRILQEEGTKGGEDTEKAAEAAMEAEERMDNTIKLEAFRRSGRKRRFKG